MSGRDNQGPRWFRSWAGKLDNPKVQRLSDAHYSAWDNLLCVACKYDGLLPPLADLAFLMRRSRPQTVPEAPKPANTDGYALYPLMPAWLLP